MAVSIPIPTPRLLLRSWRRDDVAEYASGCNTPGVMRWLGGVQSRAALRCEIDYFIASEARDGFTYWAVERRADRALLGFCGLIVIEERDCPFKGNVEVGWRIRQDAWRNGFAFEAASAVLAHAFKRLRLPEIVSRVSGGNTASRKLMAKLGLRRRRDLDYRPRGDNSKFMVYSIDAEQWRRAGERP
jgi:RimJ/RimL family protein N-acetyltransferase